MRQESEECTLKVLEEVHREELEYFDIEELENQVSVKEANFIKKFIAKMSY